MEKRLQIHNSGFPIDLYVGTLPHPPHIFQLHLMHDELRWVHILACGGLLMPRCLNNFILMEKLLNFLRNERLAKGLKQAYLADRLGVDESTISRWEYGQIVMNFAQIMSYLEVLEIDAYRMFASLASNGEQPPKSFVDLQIEIYSEEAYKAFMQRILELGAEVIIKNTKRNRWK